MASHPMRWPIPVSYILHRDWLYKGRLRVGLPIFVNKRHQHQRFALVRIILRFPYFSRELANIQIFHLVRIRLRVAERQHGDGNASRLRNLRKMVRRKIRLVSKYCLRRDEEHDVSLAVCPSADPRLEPSHIFALYYPLDGLRTL